MTEHKIEAVLTSLLLASTLTSREELVIWAWSGIGGVLSGYVGCVLFPVKGIQFRERWIINIAIAVTVAPFLTWYFMDRFASCPLPFLSMLMAGAWGALGVIVLPLLLKRHGIKTDNKKED